MRVVVCVDTAGGMLFNHRRQSRDRVLLADLLETAKGGTLYIHPFSEKLLAGMPVSVSDTFLADAGPGDTCFVEHCSFAPYLDKIDEIVIYQWNRLYPSDFSLDTRPLAHGYRLVETTDFPGSSHENITKERYQK